MQIFHYHPETGVFLGVGLADTDPKNKEIFLYPACSTPKTPPPDIEGKLTVFDCTIGEEGDWIYIDVPVPEGKVIDENGMLEPEINQELADAYEAIAALSEQVSEITSRLGAMSNV